MKKDFPFYKSWEDGKRLNIADSKEEKLSSSDKKLIADFLLFCSINSRGKKRADSTKRIMVQFCDFCETPLSKLEDKHFFHFAEAISRDKRTLTGRNYVRGIVKKFGTWYEERSGKKFKSLKLIKFETPYGSNKIQNPNELISELEFDKMMRATNNLTYKTLICMLWESAGRPEEILKSRYSDVDFIKKTIKLHSGKTGRTRLVPIDVTINHLERLKEESNTDFDSLIFTSQKQGKKLSNASFNFILQKIAKDAGIPKNITGYTFRHTRLTSLIKTLSPKSYEMFSGHSLEMGMRTYAHLSVDDLTKEMEDKIFGIRELSHGKKHELEVKIEILENFMKNMQGKLIVSVDKIKSKSDFEQIIQILKKARQKNAEISQK